MNRYYLFSLSVHTLILAMVYFCPPGIHVGLQPGDAVSIEVLKNTGSQTKNPVVKNQKFASRAIKATTPRKNSPKLKSSAPKIQTKTLLTSPKPQKVGFDLSKIQSNLSPSMQKFFFRLRSDIERAKHYPKKARRFRQSGRVHVSFKIDPSGKIHHIRLTKKTPFQTLNQSALSLLSEIQKNRYPLPKEALKSGISVVVPISYRL